MYFKSNAYNNETGTLYPERSLFGLRFKDDKTCSDFVGAHESAVVALKRAAAGDAISAPVARPQRELQTLQEEGESDLTSPSSTTARPLNHAGPVAAPEGLSSSPKQAVADAAPPAASDAGPSTADA